MECSTCGVALVGLSCISGKLPRSCSSRCENGMVAGPNKHDADIVHKCVFLLRREAGKFCCNSSYSTFHKLDVAKAWWNLNGVLLDHDACPASLLLCPHPPAVCCGKRHGGRCAPLSALNKDPHVSGEHTVQYPLQQSVTLLLSVENKICIGGCLDCQ